MSHTLLAAHLRRATKETTRKLTAALRSEVTAILRRYPAKRRPDWVSAGMLRSVAEAALAEAIASLPVDIDPDDVSDHVHQRIEAAVKHIIEKSEDLFGGKRSHSIRSGFRQRGKMVAIDDGVEGLMDDDYRDRISSQLAEMFPRCRTQKEQTVLAMFELRAPLARIRQETKLRGPDIARLLLELRCREPRKN